ncbi:negative elongation factor complex member TH1 [Dermatophagoides pteronyssinus]|uniref:Negative elongation factor D-like n=1 Tax=Dermatophagoides pteronyssinus TaxID=6956 RepID=A0A6P6Y429_DERPT|nr:negative elongation factor D-like [Dermatophagoides pteronyssinus]
MDIEMENYDDEDPAEIYRKCVELLSSKDFIMEDSVIPTLKRFIHVKGTKEEAIHLLSSNYDAVAQIANLLAEWLLMTDLTLAEVQSTVEDNLKNMIIKHFDQKKADSIFLDESKGNPDWLTALIQHQPWRKLIFQLADKYPDCLMLTFTVKLISDAGFQSEITSISTASQQLEVFTRILKTSVTNFLEKGEEMLDSEKVLTEFAKLVSHGEHTYLYSQVLLHYLSLEPKGGSNVKRLFQEISRFAQKNGHNATPIMLALMGISSHPRLAQALSAMLAKDALNPADITTLYKCYQETSPPPVEFLRIPQFLDLLLDALFKPGSKLHSEQRPKYVYLLAYASSVHEAYRKHNNAYNNVQFRKSINRDELKPTIQAIEKVSSLCVERKGSSEIMPELKTLYQMIEKYQVVAYGIVYWVKHVVSEPSYFKLNTEQTPLHLALLDEVTACHNTLHKITLNLYIDIFEKQYDELEVLAQLELKKMILDRMIHLISKGCVVPVLKYIKQCWQKGDTDISLFRYFIIEVLSMITAPYSIEFIDLFLPLVECEEVTGNMRSEVETTLVNEFIETCKNLKNENRVHLED